MEGKIKKTEGGSYRLFLPKQLVEELFHKGGSDISVDIQFPEPGKITISLKKANPLIDADSDTEEGL